MLVFKLYKFNVFFLLVFYVCLTWSVVFLHRFGAVILINYKGGYFGSIPFCLRAGSSANLLRKCQAWLQRFKWCVCGGKKKKRFHCCLSQLNWGSVTFEICSFSNSFWHWLYLQRSTVQVFQRTYYSLIQITLLLSGVRKKALASNAVLFL